MSDVVHRIYTLEGRIFELEEELAELRAKLRGETIADHLLTDGKHQSVRLSDLFGDKPHLLLIHNMGLDCAYCTMWADGFNAVLGHIESRAAFVVSSPDDVDRQRQGAAEHGWTFKMVSTKGSDLANALGFEKDGKPLPGVSALVKATDGTILRHDLASFGPGDRFCPVWNLLDLLPKA